MAKENRSFFDKIMKGAPEVRNNAEGGKNDYSAAAGGKASKSGEEGQLSVDVYETASAIVVESIIGGVKVEDINISVVNDVLTIKGVRERIEEPEDHNYFVNECFRGPFSRSIILPAEVNVDNVKAAMKNGVLKIVLPKLTGSKSRKIKIEEE